MATLMFSRPDSQKSVGKQEGCPHAIFPSRESLEKWENLKENGREKREIEIEKEVIGIERNGIYYKERGEKA